MAKDEAFTEQVRDALRHLYDPLALVRSPLAGALAPADVPEARRGRFLRTVLLEAIESLKPSPRAVFRSSQSRSYDALRLHYVEGRPVDEVGRELAVSERQAYRDIHKGEAEAAAVLWDRLLAQQEPPAAADTSLAQEVRRLSNSETGAPLGECLSLAVAAVAPLTERLGVAVELFVAPGLESQIQPPGLRQCLTALLSCAAQCGGERLAVEAAGGGNAEVMVRSLGTSEREATPPADLLGTARALALAIGAELTMLPEPHGLALLLRLPASTGPALLIVDDNEGLLELFQRYLASRFGQVVGATGAEDGLRLARELRPRAIVLDVLMPGTDGWALLDQLKRDATTCGIPVLVCSVFRDPELAKALGAAAFLPKPVSRSQLLAALASLGLR